MKTKLNRIIADWVTVKNHCRSTVNKEPSEKEPSEDFKVKLLISEHSPIRTIEFDWTWKNIKYWVSTEWSRHKFEKYISTQRTDRTGEDRNKKPQDAPVNFDGFANMQNMIDAWRKRLCNQATPEARELAEDMKIALKQNGLKNESLVLVPNCVYRCGCPEFAPCLFFDMFKAFCKKNNVDITNIQERYRAYEEFSSWRKNK